MEDCGQTVREGKDNMIKPKEDKQMCLEEEMVNSIVTEWLCNHSQKNMELIDG